MLCNWEHKGEMSRIYWKQLRRKICQKDLRPFWKGPPIKGTKILSVSTYSVGMGLVHRKVNWISKKLSTSITGRQAVLCLFNGEWVSVTYWNNKDPYQIAERPHYENTPIQIYRKFHLQKLKNIQITKHISAQNIDCGYALEPPRRGGSNAYPQYMYLNRNMKNSVYPCKPQFYYIKVGFKGVKINRHVFVMKCEKCLQYIRIVNCIQCISKRIATALIELQKSFCVEISKYGLHNLRFSYLDAI